MLNACPTSSSTAIFFAFRVEDAAAFSAKTRTSFPFLAEFLAIGDTIVEAAIAIIIEVVADLLFGKNLSLARSPMTIFTAMSFACLADPNSNLLRLTAITAFLFARDTLIFAIRIFRVDLAIAVVVDPIKTEERIAFVGNWWCERAIPPNFTFEPLSLADLSPFCAFFYDEVRRKQAAPYCSFLATCFSQKGVTNPFETITAIFLVVAIAATLAFLPRSVDAFVADRSLTRFFLNRRRRTIHPKR